MTEAEPARDTEGMPLGTAADLTLQGELNIIIFGTETRWGRAFDIILLLVILLSVAVVMLDSVEAIQADYGTLLTTLEWIFTVAFTIEYILRLYCARHRLRYATSFFGVVDLLALLPTYLSIVVAGTHSLLVIRILRLLRVFRVLKIVRMLGEAHSLMQAVRVSLPKISVFLGVVLTIVVVIGSAMHLIEGADSGFTSIPRSMYWAIVTLTTVGYGDIAPTTVLGQALAATLMIIGYGVIAVPTGIVSAEFVQAQRDEKNTIRCPSCNAAAHAVDANYCRICGAELV